MNIEVLPQGSAYWVGDGFPVRNMFPSNNLGSRISPFLMLDYAGPHVFSPSNKPRGVEQHPHRGFETVTLAYQGSVAHRDSAGNAGVIHPGDVQWMTAASGVVHEEMHDPAFTAKGGVFEMIQLWVNLPRAHKMSPPKYQSLTAAEIPNVAVGSNSVLRVISGEYQGHKGAASTFTPMDVLDLRLASGDSITLELNPSFNSSLFVMNGDVQVETRQVSGEAKLVVLPSGTARVALAASADTRILVLSGEIIDEPVAQHGPFVMNTREELVQAFRDFQEGRMGRL
jgi:redox-sensitive bicupin YhaK (pirin superfamily)